MRTARGVLLATATSFLIVGCHRAPAQLDPQFVAQWLRTSLSFVRAERLGAPVAARISAYSAIALYEGYAADSRTGLRTMAGQLNDFRPASVQWSPDSLDGPMVAAEAERVVMDSLYRDGLPNTRRTIDSLAAAQISARDAAGVRDEARARALARGRLIGNAILQWAATDSFFATRGRPWAPSGQREEWENTANVAQFVPQILSGQSDVVQFANPNVHDDVERATSKGTFTNRPKPEGVTTLPAFNPTKATEPYWGQLRTFVLRDGDECAPVAPPAYSESPTSEFYAMGRQFYDTVLALTLAKKQTALFWADNPIATGTPGFHWINVVNQMIAQRKLTADQSVELYARTSIAIADAFVGCWREKYRSNVVRPVAYVQRVFAPEFQTVIPTPPFPEYPSGHSVQSGAAVEVLIAQLGDTIAFIDSTQVDIGQPPRTYTSFSAARTEVAISRVYAGVHYFPAVVNGLVQGQCIGRRVMTALKTRSTP